MVNKHKINSLAERNQFTFQDHCSGEYAEVLGQVRGRIHVE